MSLPLVKLGLSRSKCAIVLAALLGCSFNLEAQEDSSDQQPQARVAELLEQLDELLFTVEGDVKQELSEQEQEVRAEAAQNVLNATDPNRQAAAQLEDERVRLHRDKLQNKLDFFARGDRDFIAALDVAEINQLMSESKAVAAHFGLNVEQYGKLYQIGKNAIKRSSFALSDRIPPDQREDLVSYFNDFFTFAHNRELEINKFRSELQEYKLVLTKRVTFAYIRALLAAPDKVRNCQFSNPSERISLEGQTFKSLACDDQVINNLRLYVNAVQDLAGAEAEVFGVQAEFLISQQTLMNDLAAGLPLVGDAIDMYSVYSGENLAGQCLDRTSLAISAVFSLIPFVPSSWWTYAIKRFGLEKSISRLVMFMAESAEYGGKKAAGFAAWAGMSERGFVKIQDILLAEFNLLSRPMGVKGRGKITQSARAPLARELSAEEIVYQNLKLAEEGKVIYKNIPGDLRQKTLRRSQKLLRENLQKFQKNPRHVVDVSNMVPEHIDEFVKLAKAEDSVIIFRSVNGDATNLIKANYGTKWMDVKPKSSDWGPHKGFLPYDQSFSKISNPNKLKNMSPDELAKAAKKAEEYSQLAKDCTKNPNCFKIPLELPDKSTVHIMGKGTDQVPIVKRPDGVFIDPDTKLPIDVGDMEIRPMEVMAGKNAKGEIVPLTADYDLLAVGSKKDPRSATYSDSTGFITPEEAKLVEGVNEAGKRAGYDGGNLSHHGPENQFFKSPGALAEDPVVTIIDPRDGPITVPRCDEECYRAWCQSSGMCGGIPICRENDPDVPCLPIDPDRLLKDYMHDARLRGYTDLKPNSVWDWGEVNGLSGWTPKVLLEHDPSKAGKHVFGQYRPGQGMVGMIRNSRLATLGPVLQRAATSSLKYLFSCPDSSIRDQLWNTTAETAGGE